MTVEMTPFQQQYKEAEHKFQTTLVGGDAKGVYVNAEAGTGSRYAAVVGPLPGCAWGKEGGQMLLSLLAPWTGNMVFTLFDGEEIDPSYIAEKLMGDRRHGGDLAGVALTINTAARLYMNARRSERRGLDKLMGVGE